MKLLQSLVLFCFIICTSCGINKRRNGEKVGKWISVDTLNSDIYKNIEFYKKGQAVKTWKNYKNKNLVKSEKYKGNSSIIKFYNNSKKVIATGKTKLDETTELAHWYYDGDWFYYNDDGKLTATKTYYNGVLLFQK
jgi:antitoxin component YwqK of YwqJK toxin-antitoxin module